LVEVGQKILGTLDKDLNKFYLIVAGDIKSPQKRYPRVKRYQALTIARRYEHYAKAP